MSAPLRLDSLSCDCSGSFRTARGANAVATARLFLNPTNAQPLYISYIIRERREALTKEGRTGGATGPVEELPDRFFKLPRVRFLLLLCREMFRINR